MAALILADSNPGCPGLAIAPTAPMLHDVLMPAFREFFQETGIRYREMLSRKNFILPDKRVVIRCRSAHKPETIRGQTVAWAILDEMRLMSDSTFKIIEGRIRHPNANYPTIIGATTPNGFDWVYDLFAAPDRNARRQASYRYVHAPTHENRFVLEANPDLIRDFAESYDTEFFKQEVEGQFVNIGGHSTYYAFDRHKHFAAHEVAPGLPLWLCVDFNVHGTWVIAQDPGLAAGPIRALDEITVSSGDMTTLAAREFLRRYGEHPSGWEIYGDATGASRKTTGRSDFEIIRDTLGAVVYAKHGNPRVIDRVAAVNGRLLNANGKIGLVVHPTRCPELVRDFEQVKNVPGTREIDKGNPKRTHASDALGYAVHYRYPVLAGRDIQRAA